MAEVLNSFGIRATSDISVTLLDWAIWFIKCDARY